MEINANERAEIMAKAFHAMTGHFAPFKDPTATAGDTYAERRVAWDEWLEDYGDVLKHVINAVEYIMEG